MYSTKQLHDRTLVINTDQVINGGENIPNMEFYCPNKSYTLSHLEYLISNKHIYYFDVDSKNTQVRRGRVIDELEDKLLHL